MVHPVRMLARLTSKGAWFEASGGGQGVKREGMLVPSSEIAGALGMGDLSRAAYYLGLAIFADDNSAVNKLVLAMSPAVEYQLAESGFPADRLRALCELAVVEVLWPRRCSDCNGEGVYTAPYTLCVGHGYQVAAHRCDRCSAKGRVSFTQRDAAKVIGISQVGFRKAWITRANVARAVLASLEDQLLAHVRAQMVDDWFESIPVCEVG